MKVQPGPLTHKTEPTSSVEVAAQTPVVGVATEAARFGPRSSDRSRPSVELHIEELVLDGFEPAHRHTIGDAIERELARLFTGQGAPARITQGSEIAHLDARSLEVTLGSNPETIGLLLAKAIYEGLAE